MKLVLPLPPNMANGRMHWRAKNKKREQYEERAWYWCADARQRPPRTPLPTATLRATLYVHNIMDTDGAVARLKWPVDFLVKGGWLTDDNPKVLTWTIPEQAIDRKNPRVEIELVAVEVGK